MRHLATALVDIALRRRGPESLPDSRFLLALLVVVYVVLQGASLMLDGKLEGREILLLVGDTTLALAFIFSVLAFFKLERRFRQTAAAILGADIVINLAALPFVLAALGMGLTLNEPPFAYVLLIFFFWSIFIASWVLARSLSQPLIVGVMFEILYLFIAWSLVDLLAANPELTSTAAS